MLNILEKTHVSYALTAVRCDLAMASWAATSGVVPWCLSSLWGI